MERPERGVPSNLHYLWEKDKKNYDGEYTKNYSGPLYERIRGAATIFSLDGNRNHWRSCLMGEILTDDGYNSMGGPMTRTIHSHH